MNLANVHVPRSLFLATALLTGCLNLNRDDCADGAVPMGNCPEKPPTSSADGSGGALSADAGAVSTSDGSQAVDGSISPNSPPQIDGGSGVTVIGVAPADGATRVSILGRVTVRLTGVLDPGSVTDSAVWLSLGDSNYRPPVGVSYDPSTGAITISPLAPLEYGTEYRVQVVGLRSAGKEVARFSTRFRTFRNPSVSEADLTNFVTYTHDSEGRLQTRTLHHQPGVAGMFATESGPVIQYVVYQYPSEQVRRSVYYNPGPDKTFGSSDDIVAAYEQSSFGAGLRVQTTLYETAGLDGVWFTADDTFLESTLYAYDEMGRRSRAVTVVGFGRDAIPATADDDVKRYVGFIYVGRCLVDELNHGTAGPDGLWFTADDPVEGGVHRQCNDAGIEMNRETRESGTDEKYGTADDKISWQSHNEVDSQGLIRRTIYPNPGSPGTPDSPQPQDWSYSFDSQGNRRESAFHLLNPDGSELPANWVLTFDPSL
jgi:hypothetical protein